MRLLRSRDPPGPAPLTRLRRARHRRGRLSEILAAAFLMGKGYRILARRQRTPLGEIDLIAVRGERLAFVEVKQRATREEAEAAVSPRQRDRVRRAAGYWLGRHPRYQSHELGFDVIFFIGRRWPRHLENAL
jgi:putative endonuclease